MSCCKSMRGARGKNISGRVWVATQTMQPVLSFPRVTTRAALELTHEEQTVMGCNPVSHNLGCNHESATRGSLARTSSGICLGEVGWLVCLSVGRVWAMGPPRWVPWSIPIGRRLYSPTAREAWRLCGLLLSNSSLLPFRSLTRTTSASLPPLSDGRLLSPRAVPVRGL